MSATLLGLHDWSLTRDDDGFKEYLVVWKVKTTSANDGPEVVVNVAGIPSVGTAYAIGNDANSWAFAYPRTRVERTNKRSGAKRLWYLHQTFSTKPLLRCQTAAVASPLLEPTKIGGSFVRQLREATEDNTAQPLVNSAKQRFTGKLVEIDDYRPTIEFEWNQATNPVALLAEYLVDGGAVNDSTLYGLSARKIRVSSGSWEKRYYGVCTAYYNVRVGLEVNFDTWDRKIPDEGRMVFADVLGDGDKANPKNYVRAKDHHGENIEVRLNLAGEIWDGTTPADPTHTFKLHPEKNLLLLGIPSSL